jgi:O-antigen biosynthesis protein
VNIPSRRPAEEPPAQRPIQVVELDLSVPCEPLERRADPTGQPYGLARVLARLHGEPLGNIEIEFDSGAISPDNLLALVRLELEEPLRRHLDADGLELPQTLPESGVQTSCSSRLPLAESPELVTVVLLTAGEPAKLLRCLDSVLASQHPNFEVLVVDTHPTLATVESLLAECYGSDGRVRCIHEPQQTWAAARNTGLLFARGDLISFVCDSVTVDPDWLTVLAAEFAADPATACVTGLIQHAELDTPTQIYHDAVMAFGGSFQRRVVSPEDQPYQLLPLVVGLPGLGANMALRRSVLGDLWGFDVALGPGSVTKTAEDVDSVLRLVLSGQRVVHQPRALVWQHYTGDYQRLLTDIRASGVGLGAAMTKQLLTSHHSRWRQLRHLSAEVQLLLAEKDSHGVIAVGARRAITHQELIGLAKGPIAYIHSRLRLAWLSA